MKKIILSVALVVGLYGGDYGDEKIDSWRNGFITAYKAMEVDTQQQGLESKKMNVKRHIIYFDANSEDIAIWDKLMVQMFGYSASIHKPVRTTKDWIIFASYDDKATAVQEFELLNQKIFKNSKRYKLQLFDNVKGEVFYNDKALLTSQLVELKELLKIAEEQKLKAKEQELEENQKVALIFVDKETGEVVEAQKETKEQIVPMPAPIVESVSSEPSHIKKESPKKIDQKRVKANRAVFVKAAGFVKQKRDEIILFSRPTFDGKFKVRTAKKGEVVPVESKNGYNWYKVKDAELYIAGHLVLPASKSSYETFLSKQQRLEKELKEKMSERALGSFTITSDSVVTYKLKSQFELEKTKYSLEDFVFLELMENDYKKYKYSAIVEDSDGVKYVKLFDENVFIPYGDIFLIK